MVSLLFLIFFGVFTRTRRARTFCDARAVSAVLARVFSRFIRRTGGLLRGGRAHHDRRKTSRVQAAVAHFACVSPAAAAARPVSSGCCAAGAAVCGLLACCV